MFEALGVLDEFMRLSIPLPLMRAYKADSGSEVLREYELLPTVDPSPDRPYVSSVPTEFCADFEAGNLVPNRSIFEC